jgi:pyridinium-3,5-biscarboxylic acid mononucleotide sulfurtransferase
MRGEFTAGAKSQHPKNRDTMNGIRKNASVTVELPNGLRHKYEALEETIAKLESVVVAYSGGVDSALLLRVAIDVLGAERVLAVTADSETYPRRELEAARALAHRIGARHEVVRTSELEIPGYAENNRERCYFCRRNLFEYLEPLRQSGGYAYIAYGLITDDIGDFRPGVRAAVEKGVRGPLKDAALGKAEVRELSYALGLPTWNKPSLACLSSRVQFGERITREKLNMIDEAEEHIRSFGVEQVRVRSHNGTARIEVEEEDIETVMSNRTDIHRRLHELGFQFVSVDLAGYRSGSMNRGLE